MQKIKKGDVVIVRTGKEKSKTGKVLKIIFDDKDPKKIIKAIVEGLNLVKKHKKPDSSKKTEGGIIVKEKPIHISNLALFNQVTKKADKVGFKFMEKDQVKIKVRYFKSNQEVVDVR